MEHSRRVTPGYYRDPDNEGDEVHFGIVKVRHDAPGNRVHRDRTSAGLVSR